jgi:Domain of unknown function (DUF5916)/Carbohydrate family 9 binding domain-like
LKNLLLLTALFSVSLSFSQRTKNKSVNVKYITEPITVDAILDEAAWSQTKPATNFWEYFPIDTVQAKQQAEIKMLFDDNNLYIGIKVNAPSNDFIVPSLRRDFRAGGSDNITLLFDTFNDGTNAFIFGTNPEGVQREMLLSGGGADIRSFNMAWDTKWKSETKIHDTYYIAEWEIPLSAFKYREGETKWRFNSYHFDTQYNEQNTWINVPQNQFFFNLAYMGDMIFEKPLGNSKSPVSLIPFVNGITSKDYENNTSLTDFKFGGDVKFTINNSLNLDLTINPDFSQVEADQLITNLTRFEVFLPELRQFFIDNSDLFADFGNGRDANPFFSRRIGLGTDMEGNTIENDIIAGVRLSGKVNNNLRIGVLNMQTAEDKANEIPTTNNTVLTAQYKMFSRSNLSVMFINKQPMGNNSFVENQDKYNRIFGLDYRLASEDNTWTGKYFIHKSFSPNINNKDISAGVSTTYSNKNWNVRLSGVLVGDNFRSDLGFIRRTDIFKINPQIQYSIWPKKGNIQKHSFSSIPIFIWKPTLNFESSDYTIISRYEANFQNTSRLNFEMFNRFTHLYNEFDPTGTDGAIPLPANKNYYYTNYSASYRSDQRNTFSYSISPSVGKFYNGEKYSIGTQMTWRIQPHFSGSIQINYDKINLPKPYASANIWLIGPKIDITFNKDLFWATFIQYSSQSENFSINSRLQWRFAPLSDLYIVYNDNYFTDNVFAPRVRAFNIKLTYWLNI